MTAHDLDGLVAMVTGAAYGLGRAIAEELGRRGATLVLTDIDDRLDATACEMAKDHAVFSVRLDVTERASVLAGVRHAVESCGRLDILVNNAGYSRTTAAILDIDADEWDLSMNINVRGALYCIQEAGKVMKQAGKGGRIINIASTAAFRPYKQKSPYCVSKTALVALTRCAALELAEHRITVNAVAPGQTDTETTRLLQSDPHYGDGMRRRAAAIPMGGMGTPGDIANAVAFFASPASAQATGQTLLVDGGSLLL
jgi:NAD(P)-dependent dehydrogenase (short-subunit alcohol dehydrogenase family)